ncbi:uncharacterized protein LOC131942724 [Physella acuta]|uniref:uncharacterized protein LOC131942724 n=1 Tax=Physella acuta TaxID=109671 RepID=UPI0027DE5FAE|nr:uncharacterized protein LOC131942724 [Physella acuta]
MCSFSVDDPILVASLQKDCPVESFRQKCEQQRKECVQTPLGGLCVKKKKKKTGKEEIGTSSCTVNTVTYKLYECSSRGDPHYRTPDGTKLDFEGGCSYNLMSTCNNYPELGVFSGFSIVSPNLREYPQDKSTITKSFQFVVQDRTYLFTRGEFMVNNVYVPEVYKTYVCGICGNFDDNPKNDLTIPGSNKTVSADVLGRYHMVGGVAGEGCTDTTKVPEPCSAENNAKFSGNEYCGIFKSSNNASPLVKAVTSGSDDSTRGNNLEKLDEYFEDCVMDQCRRFNYGKNDSCLALGSSVQELIKQLNINDENLHENCRSFANCPNNCGRNMEYKKSYRPQCQDSCKETHKSITCDDLNTASGCACQDGFLLDADQNCVPADDCDNICTVRTVNSAFMLNDGQSSFVEACSKKITCQKGTINETNLGPCSENADCVDGTKCVCKQGFKGDGRECFADLACKPGFYPAGTKCYQVRFDNLDWHSAALVCGSQGAQLARMDNEADAGLEQVLKKIPEYKIVASATSKILKCGVNSTCAAPKNEVILSIRALDNSFSKSCDGKFVISGDRSQVTCNCAAKTFIISSVESKLFNARENCPMWIGGNLDVVGPNARLDTIPFQVDSPRQIDMTQFKKSSGCFQAVVDESNIAVFPNPDCKARQGFICDYDPNDFKFIKELSSQQEAIEKCKYLNRTLAVLDSIGQLNKALTLMTSNAFVYMTYDKLSGDFKWGNGMALSSSLGKVERKSESILHFSMLKSLKIQEQTCVILNKANGKLQEQSCVFKAAALCGPITNSIPAGYTPYFPATTVQSVTELKKQLMRDGQQDQLCASPLVIECSALSNEGRWVTNFDQQGTTITCKPDLFSCLSGQELNCKTFRIRILCPQTKNQCTELAKSGSTPCDGAYCGECMAVGDPHYTTYTGAKFDNMALCTTQFTGTCPFDKDGSAVSYQVLTKNKICGGGGASCVNKVHIKVQKLPVTGINGVQLKENLDFIVYVGAKSYILNGKTISQTDFTRQGVFSAVVRQGYFEVLIHAIGLQVVLSDNKLKVMAPEQYRQKMCGLCGDCGSKLFKLKNGTAISVNYNNQIMGILANEWRVADEDDNADQCQILKTTPNDGCTDAKRAELAKPNLCGVFKDKSSSIQECFDKTEMEPKPYYEDCLYDACRQTDSQEAVCNMVKAFAQECLTRVCGNGKIFRTDVSCEPTCGRSVVSQTNCMEAREEGCACPAGKMKQGEDCVDPKDCGCNVPMKNGTVNWHLLPESSVLMPECKETAVCYTDEIGSSKVIYRPFNLDQNALCNSNIPPSVECAKGYTMDTDGVTCKRDPKICSRSYENINGLCVKVPSETNEWRLALKACNKEDGTLISIDTDHKLNTIKNILADRKIGPVWIAGRVVARKGARGNIYFQSVLSDNDKGKIEVANYDCPDNTLRRIKLSPDISLSSITQDGLVLSVMITKEGDAVAVLSTSKATPVCVLREVTDNQTQWFDSCNNDNNMEDGDQETHHSMLMNPNCLVCLNPMDVRCVANPNPKVIGSIEGDCANRADGLFYDCNQGRNCVDKGVSTKCTKDYDECTTGLHDCPANSECVNTVGDFSCKCKPEFPLMVRGQCQSFQRCVMQGPAAPLDYVYNIQTLSGKEGLLDFTCKFKLATLCDQYKASSGLPSISIYILSTRVAGALQPYYSGTCYNPDNGVVKTWAVTPDLLRQGYIMLGNSNANSVQTALSFTDPATSVSYQFVAPGTLIISHQSGFFKVTITANSIRTEFSGEYRDKLCGVCAASSVSSGGFLELSQSELQEVSVLQESVCAPRTPIPALPTEPHAQTTASPTTGSITTYRPPQHPDLSANPQQHPDISINPPQHPNISTNPPQHPNISTNPPQHPNISTNPPQHPNISTNPPQHPDISANPPQHPNISTNPPQHPDLSANPQQHPDISINPPQHPDISTNPPQHPNISTNPPQHPDLSANPQQHPDISTNPPQHPDISTNPPQHPNISTNPPQHPDISTNHPQHSNISTKLPQHPDISSKPPQHPEKSTNPPQHTDISTKPPQHPNISTNFPQHPDISTNPPQHPDISTNPPQHPNISTKLPQHLVTSTNPQQHPNISTKHPQHPNISTKPPQHPNISTKTPQHPNISTNPPQHPNISTKRPQHTDISTNPQQHPDISTNLPQHPDISTNPPQHPNKSTKLPQHLHISTKPPQHPNISTNPPQHPNISTNPPQHPNISTNPPQHPNISTKPPQHTDISTKPHQHPDISTNTPQHPDISTNPPQHTDISTNPPQHPYISTNPPQHANKSTKLPQHPHISTKPPQHPDISTNPPQHPNISTKPPQHTDISTNPPQYPNISTNPPQHPDISTNPPQHPKISTNPPQHPDISTNPPQHPNISTNPPQHTDISTNPPQHPNRATHSPKQTDVSTHRPKKTYLSTHPPQQTYLSTQPRQYLDKSTHTPIYPDKPTHDLLTHSPLHLDKPTNSPQNSDQSTQPPNQIDKPFPLPKQQDKLFNPSQGPEELTQHPQYPNKQFYSPKQTNNSNYAAQELDKSTHPLLKPNKPTHHQQDADKSTHPSPHPDKTTHPPQYPDKSTYPQQDHDKPIYSQQQTDKPTNYPQNSDQSTYPPNQKDKPFLFPKQHPYKSSNVLQHPYKSNSPSQHPNTPTYPQQPDQSTTPRAIFPTYPDDVSTRGEPLEPVTIPTVITTLAPDTTQSTTLSPDEDPCSYQAIDDCNALNLLCNVPINKCKAAICPGTQDLCQYLVSQQFTCKQTDNLKLFSKRCNKLCGANMEFKYTSRTDQPSCAKPSKSDMVSQNANDDVGFICACEDGYVQSRAECVRLSDCGCVMPSGKYYPAGHQWRSANCAELKTCLGNNNVDVQVSSCGKNTECTNTEKGPTCICKKGLFGNPDMPQGCEKGVVSHDGSKTCYTYATHSGDEERCDCNMGFASNCEECLDMDECAEGTHQCNLAYEKCVNVPGGYRCDCADGYTFKGGKCVDLDECIEKPGICREHSQCTNKVGSYECSCCVGYLWNPVSKSCERDNASVPDLPEGAACCAICNDAVLCDESISSPIPYCYTDNGENKQYSSYMKLYQDRCINNQPFDGDKLLRGKCPAKKSPKSAPKKIRGKPKKPSTPAPFPTSCDAPSLCSALPPPPPNLASGPVCGPANSQTPESFPSYCDMVKAECKKSGNPADLPKTSPIKANPGKCSGSGHGSPTPLPRPPAEPIFTPWTPYSTCQLAVPGAECGVGIQIRNRELAPYDDGRPVRNVNHFELNSNRTCYVPCPKPKHGQPARSNCPETSFCNAVEPVCGSIGTGAASQFKSECKLNVTACQKSDVPNKLYAGDCDAEDSGAKKRYCEEAGPVDDLMTYNVEKDGLHCVGQPVNVGNCGNLLCSGAEGTCCKAVEYEKIQVVAECFSKATKKSVDHEKHIYFSATKCKCQSIKP